MQARRAALVAVALLAGCSGDGGSGSEGTGAGSGSAPGSSGTTDATADGGGAPLRGGVLRLALERPPSFDPLDALPGSASASIVADLLYDGLTASGERTAVPALASHWETPDGAVTWRFTLRPDAVFADGRPVTAADVVASLQRAVARGVPGLPVVVAVRAAADAEGVVEVVLERPVASLPELLAAPAFGVAGPVGDPATGGTGPFRLAGVDPADPDLVHLSRAEGGRAYLDGVDLRLFDDAAGAYAAFEAGTVDWSVVPPNRAEAAAEAYGSEGFVPFQSQLVLGFDLADPVFADVRFRQAIAAAVDRAAVVGAVYFGVAAPLATLVPEGVPGHDPARCGQGCQHDPDVARVLLAQAFPPGGPGIPEVVLGHDGSATLTALAQAVQQQLSAVGIPASVAATADAAAGLRPLGWVGTTPTPEAYLDPRFRTGSPDNQVAFTDPVVDVLLEGAARELDHERRLSVLADAEAAVLAAMPVVPLAQFRFLSVATPAVQDLDPSVAGTFDPTAVWLAG